MSSIHPSSVADAPAPHDVPSERLDAAIAASEARILQMVSEMVGGSDPSGRDPVGMAVESPDLRSWHPFEVYYDFADKKYKMYLPKGSVVVGTTDVTPDKAPDITEGNTYYLHVKLIEPAFSGNSPDTVKIDSAESAVDYDLTVAIAKISNENGVEEQFLSSSLILSPKRGTGLFDPEYDSSGKLKGSVFNPYLVVGRRVIRASGRISANGTWGVEVTHKTDSVSATIRSIDTPLQSNSSKEKTIIPLYKIGSSGSITEDYRGLQCVPLYDPKST